MKTREAPRDLQSSLCLRSGASSNYSPCDERLNDSKPEFFRRTKVGNAPGQ